MVREISKQRYLVAGIITVLIFTVGLLMGSIFDYERLQTLETKYRQSDLDYRSLQLQLALLDSIDSQTQCPAFNIAMNQALKELDSSLKKVEQYQQVSEGQEDEYIAIQRKYVLDNLRYWSLVEKVKDICETNKFSIIYFHSINNCPSCSDQGAILSYFKEKYGNSLLIFPINIDLEPQEPIISLLLETYGIEELPSFVAGDKVYSGIVYKEEIQEILCNSQSQFCEEN